MASRATHADRFRDAATSVEALTLALLLLQIRLLLQKQATEDAFLEALVNGRRLADSLLVTDTMVMLNLQRLVDVHVHYCSFLCSYSCDQPSVTND